MPHPTLLELAISYDFSTEQEYFNYIIDSEINGQPQQVLSLYQEMQQNDKNLFIHYLVNESATLHAERDSIMSIIFPTV